MEKLLNLFNYENESVIDKNEIFLLLTEENLVLIEDYYLKNDIDINNVYFKLLHWLFILESNYSENKIFIAYLNYIIGTYIGHYLHPTNSKEIGLKYLEKAIFLETDVKKLELYKISKERLEETP